MSAILTEIEQGFPPDGRYAGTRSSGFQALVPSLVTGICFQ